MDLGDIEHPDETLAKCVEHLRLFRMLQDNPAWQMLQTYLGDSAKYLENDILSHAIEPNGVLRQEYMKGKASALRSIPALLEDYCETLESNARRITMLMKDNEDAPRDQSFDYRTESAEYREPEPSVP